MKRLPILPTLIVAAAVAGMIALGVWQLQRAAWKEAMLAELAAARDLPPVDLDAVRGDEAAPPIAFRRATITCRSGEQRPSLRAGRNLRGTTGYSYFIPCRPGAPGLAGRVEINAGWAQAPDGSLRLAVAGPIAGRVGTVEPEGSVILTADAPLGPLEASAPPSIDEIPNNHLMYAFQWFFFAATAALIYALALRGRKRSPKDEQSQSA